MPSQTEKNLTRDRLYSAKPFKVPKYDAGRNPVVYILLLLLSYINVFFNDISMLRIGDIHNIIQ